MGGARLAITAILLACSAPALAERPWAKPEGEVEFSAEALNAWDERGMFRHSSKDPVHWKAQGKARVELLSCLGEQPAARCMPLILKGWFLLDHSERGPLGPLLDAAEQAFPVEPLTVSGDQRLPADPETALFGLIRLRAIAEATEGLLGRDHAASVRRRLAFEVARWRAGGPVSSTNILASDALDNAQTGPFMRLLEVSQVADNSYVPPETLARAQELRRSLGPIAASNLALVQLAQGLGPAAEASAREGYEALRSAKGAEDPRTIAAALILARVLESANKADAARVYARIAYEGRRKDRFATLLQRLDSAQQLAEVTEGQERTRLEQEALALIEQQLGKPMAPVFARFAQLPTIGDVALDQRVATNHIEQSEGTAQRALKARKSRLLANQAFAILMTDPARARELLREADRASSSAKVVFQLALLRFLDSKDGSELATSTEFQNLWSLANNTTLAEDHPDRILGAWLTAAYYGRFSSGEAPAYARLAAKGVTKRLGQHRGLSEEAMTEITGMRPIFVTQVQANWWAGQLLSNP